MNLKSSDDLPASFGEIDGHSHPDTIIANVNWNAALDEAVRLIKAQPGGLARQVRNMDLLDQIQKLKR